MNIREETRVTNGSEYVDIEIREACENKKGDMKQNDKEAKKGNMKKSYMRQIDIEATKGDMKKSDVRQIDIEATKGDMKN